MVTVTQMDPFVDRSEHRITLIRPLATTCDVSTQLRPFHERFKLGRLDRYVTRTGASLPMISEIFIPAKVQIPELSTVATVSACRLRLAAAENEILLAMVSIDLSGSLRDVIAVLNAGYTDGLRLDDKPLAEICSEQWLGGGECSAETERHQVVFWSGDQPPDLDVVQRLVYRADLPALPEYCSFVRPAELNRRPESCAYLGPYVSVLHHHQDYVENAALLSAMLVVIASLRVRVIKSAARTALNEVISNRETDLPLSSRRANVGRLASQLRDLHVQLAFEVEDSSTLVDVIPSLRVDAFHRALWEAIELRQQSDTASRILERLTSAVAAEQQAIEAAEARATDWRRLSWSVPVAIVSAVAIPATVLFAFFAVQTNNVRRSTSLLDFSLYWPIYLVLALVILAAAITGLVLRSHGLSLVRRDQEQLA